MTLVDVTEIFVKRRRIFYFVVFLFSVSGLSYALVAPEKFEYFSLVQLARGVNGVPLESSSATLAVLENQRVPQVESGYFEQEGDKLPFGVSLGSVDQTGLISIRSEAKQIHGSAVTQTHNELIRYVTERQGILIKREEKTLQRQIESLENTRQTLQNGDNTAEALVEVVRQKLDLENKLENLQPLEVLVTARRGVDETGLSRVLILVASVIFGFFFGTVAALLAEFVTIVRAQIVSSGDEA